MALLTCLLPRVGTPSSRDIAYMLRNNPDGADVRIVGCDQFPDPVQSHWMDAFYHASPSEVCKKEDIDLILPQYDSDAHELHGLPVMATAPSIVKRACDKEQLLKLFQELDLPIPAYSVVTSAEELEQAARALGYPEKQLVLKPTNMWGSRGLCILTEKVSDDVFSTRAFGAYLSLEMAKKALNGRFLLMEYLPGTEYSVDAFIGEKAEVAIPRVRVFKIGGLAWETILDHRQDLVDSTLKAAKALGLKYTFGMQYKLDAEGQPKILECNPRIQGTMIASYFSGVNLIWMAVKEALGDPPAQPKGPFKTARFRRYLAGIASGDDWHVEI